MIGSIIAEDKNFIESNYLTEQESFKIPLPDPLIEVKQVGNSQQIILLNDYTRFPNVEVRYSIDKEPTNTDTLFENNLILNELCEFYIKVFSNNPNYSDSSCIKKNIIIYPVNWNTRSFSYWINGSFYDEETDAFLLGTNSGIYKLNRETTYYELISNNINAVSFTKFKGDIYACQQTTSNTIWKSSDGGNTWSSVTTLGNYCSKLISSDNFIIGFYSNYLYYSTNGTSWATVDINQANSELNKIYSIACNNNAVVLTVSLSEYSNWQRFVYTTDFENFNIVVDTQISYTDIFYLNNKFILYTTINNDKKVIFTSEDGVNWNTNFVLSGIDWSFSDLLFYKGLFIGIGYSGTTSYSASVMCSSDLINWVNIELTPIDGGQYRTMLLDLKTKRLQCFGTNVNSRCYLDNH